MDVPSTTETLVPTPSTSDFDLSAISLVAKSTDEFLRHAIHPILKRHFRREEFLGRINDIVVFHPLADKDLQETVETELSRWKVKAYERHGIVLEWSRRLVESLKGGYDERYGYRSMIYTVEKRVVNLLAASPREGPHRQGERGRAGRGGGRAGRRSAPSEGRHQAGHSVARGRAAGGGQAQVVRAFLSRPVDGLSVQWFATPLRLLLL